MKKGIRASVLAFVMVFTFVTSLMGNAMVVRADESTKNVKIAKAIYDGTRLKVTMAGSLKDGTNAFSVVSSDGEEVAIKAVNGKGAIFNIEMEEALNPAKRYHIICGGNSYAITMPDYYGTPEFEEAYTYSGNSCRTRICSGHRRAKCNSIPFNRRYRR